MTKKKNQKNSAKKSSRDPYDGGFAFKLALYLILGTLWVKVTNGTHVVLPIPVGLIIGMAFTAHEHFKIDRKIEYAVLMIAAFVGFWAPFGLYITY